MLQAHMSESLFTSPLRPSVGTQSICFSVSQGLTSKHATYFSSTPVHYLKRIRYQPFYILDRFYDALVR